MRLQFFFHVLEVIKRSKWIAFVHWGGCKLRLIRTFFYRRWFESRWLLHYKLLNICCILILKIILSGQRLLLISLTWTLRIGLLSFPLIHYATYWLLLHTFRLFCDLLVANSRPHKCLHTFITSFGLESNSWGTLISST